MHFIELNENVCHMRSVFDDVVVVVGVAGVLSHADTFYPHTLWDFVRADSDVGGSNDNNDNNQVQRQSHTHTHPTFLQAPILFMPKSSAQQCILHAMHLQT